jgi:hypothetical protein
VEDEFIGVSESGERNALKSRAEQRVGILRLRLFFALGARRTILAQDDNRDAY